MWQYSLPKLVFGQLHVPNRNEVFCDVSSKRRKGSDITFWMMNSTTLANLVATVWTLFVHIVLFVETNTTSGTFSFGRPSKFLHSLFGRLIELVKLLLNFTPLLVKLPVLQLAFCPERANDQWLPRSLRITQIGIHSWVLTSSSKWTCILNTLLLR